MYLRRRKSRSQLARKKQSRLLGGRGGHGVCLDSAKLGPDHDACSFNSPDGPAARLLNCRAAEGS